METTDTNLPYTNTDLHSLVINELTKDKYDKLATQGLISENELYIVTDAETAVKVKEGGALSGDGTSGDPLDISDEFKSQLSGDLEEITNKITQEASDRQSADATLQANINSEAETLANKDTELQGAIESEVETRQSEITRVEGLITTEANTRAEGDENLTELVNTEVQNLKDTKQDNLTAGTNIEIVDNTVSTIATQVIRRKW